MFKNEKAALKTAYELYQATKKAKYICDITLDELMEIYTKQSGKCYIIFLM